MINRSAEKPLAIGSPSKDPQPLLFVNDVIGCLDEWRKDGQVPGGMEPTDTVIEQCAVNECDKSKEYHLDPNQTMQIVCEGLCKKSLLQ